MARIRRHSAPTLHAAANRRGRDNHDALPVRPRRVQGPVHPQLAVPLLLRRLVRPHRRRGGDRPDCAVLGFFLHLLHQVRVCLPLCLLESLLTTSPAGLCKGPSSTFRCRALRGESFTSEKRGRAELPAVLWNIGAVLFGKTGLGWEPFRASANVMHGLAKKRGRNKGSPIIQAWEVELEKTGFSWAEAASYYLPDQCTRVTSRTQRHR